MTPWVTMSLRVCSIWSQYSICIFLWACWTGGNGRVSPGGIGTGHVAYHVKQAKECLLLGNNVLGHHYGRVCLSWGGVGAARCRGLKGWCEPCVTGEGWDVWPCVFFGLFELYCLCGHSHGMGRGALCGWESKGSLEVIFSGLPLATWG